LILGNQDENIVTNFTQGLSVLLNNIVSVDYLIIDLREANL